MEEFVDPRARGLGVVRDRNPRPLIEVGVVIGELAGAQVEHAVLDDEQEGISVELWVDRVESEAGDELRVRLQSDEGGAPIAPNDGDSDISSTTWEYDNLPSGDWKDFFFDEHTLADRDPWLIIEAGGETGHDIGFSAADELAYRSYYPHPLTFEVQDNDSVRRYGPREQMIERGTLKTLAATRDVANSELARRAWPEKTVEFDVASETGHYIAPDDVTTLDVPGSRVNGEYIVTEVQHTWDSGSVVLDTSVSATWRKGVLAPQD